MAVEPEALRCVVRYIACGTLELTPYMTFGVLAAVNYLELESAKVVCASFMCSG